MPEQPFNKALLAIRQLVVFTLTVLITTIGASADDLDIYDTTGARPKVVFVLDTSGSMDEVDDGETQPRLTRMVNAMNDLLDRVSGIDVGIMRYSHSGAQLLHEAVNAENNRVTLKASISTLDHDGATPTVAALYEAQRYLKGATPYRGRNGWSNRPYNQPASNQCESNHIIVLSDGEPSPDSTVVTDLNSMIGNCANTWGANGKCGPELAKHMATTNQFTNIPEDNFITTHTIGFNLEDEDEEEDDEDEWLESLATEGGGLYRVASSKNELLAVFQAIINEVQITATTAAPTVSVNAFNQSRHRNELFYSFFQPGGAPRWDGNVKKYKLNNGDIVDYYDIPIIENDIVSPSSVSLWSFDEDGVPVADGDRVASGGTAARQPAPRRWFTDYGISADANGNFFAAQITANQDLPKEAFGALDNLERNRLVEWALGYDSIDRDVNSNTTEPNRYVADSIHSSPLLISYKAHKQTDVLEEALFYASNMGVLHAINPVTGDELWSYSPAELLPNTKAYVDNVAENHVYGLDGALVADITYKTTTTMDYETDQVRLYLTQRRGGSSIFALDVSNAPASNKPVERLWTINGGIAGTAYRDLAQTWSKPQLIPIRVGCPTNCSVREVLMFSGGYNPLYDNETLTFPVTVPATGHGNAIYLADPDTGALLWSAGNGTHHKLNLTQSSAANGQQSSGMNDSVPATPIPVDTDADGVVNVLFYSDIAGNVWRVDLNQQAQSYNDLAIAGGKIAALNEAGQNFRFFNRPDVVINGNTVGASNFSIVLGSGMRSSPTYTEPNRNRMFVINDPWVFSKPTILDATTNQPQTDYRYAKDSNDNPKVIKPADLWQHNANGNGGPTVHGFFKVLDPREKVLQPTLTHSGRVFLTTYMPHDPQATDNPCAYFIGESRMYIIDLQTGANKLPTSYGGQYIRIGSGIVAGPQIFDSGQTGGPDMISGLNSEKLVDLLDPNNPEIFRRFFRTGWNELEP